MPAQRLHPRGRLVVLALKPTGADAHHVAQEIAEMKEDLEQFQIVEVLQQHGILKHVTAAVKIGVSEHQRLVRLDSLAQGISEWAAAPPDAFVEGYKQAGRCDEVVQTFRKHIPALNELVEQGHAMASTALAEMYRMSELVRVAHLLRVAHEWGSDGAGLQQAVAEFKQAKALRSYLSRHESSFKDVVVVATEPFEFIMDAHTKKAAAKAPRSKIAMALSDAAGAKIAKELEQIKEFLGQSDADELVAHWQSWQTECRAGLANMGPDLKEAAESLMAALPAVDTSRLQWDTEDPGFSETHRTELNKMTPEMVVKKADELVQLLGVGVAGLDEDFIGEARARCACLCAFKSVATFQTWVREDDPDNHKGLYSEAKTARIEIAAAFSSLKDLPAGEPEIEAVKNCKRFLGAARSYMSDSLGKILKAMLDTADIHVSSIARKVPSYWDTLFKDEAIFEDKARLQTFVDFPAKPAVIAATSALAGIVDNVDEFVKLSGLQVEHWIELDESHSIIMKNVTKGRSVVISRMACEAILKGTKDSLQCCEAPGHFGCILLLVRLLIVVEVFALAWASTKCISFMDSASEC